MTGIIKPTEEATSIIELMRAGGDKEAEKKALTEISEAVQIEDANLWMLIKRNTSRSS